MNLFKNGIVEQFTGTIPTTEILLSLLAAFITSLLVSYIYKKTYTGVAYTKSAILTIVLLAMVTSLVIRTINSNLALSLGMVGALSIVRFRTAVKDPLDTIFMFWAITIGIMSGAGLYLITFVSSLMLGLLYMGCHMTVFKPSNKYLLIINTSEKEASDIIDTVMKKKKCVLKTTSAKKGNVELTFEIADKNSAKYLLELKSNNAVESIHLVNIE